MGLRDHCTGWHGELPASSVSSNSAYGDTSLTIHSSHAIELERVAKFNPHVGFFDVHGRVCERMVVEDLLSSVYPVDPPQYSEILKPEYDLPPEELPKYSAY